VSESSEALLDDIDGLLSAMETLRVHRPRVVIHGSIGMGQGYIGSAALHHLEGYHIQSLELGGLMGDSTRVSIPLCEFIELLTVRSRLQKLPLSNCSSRRRGISLL
jgi:hypothetical protein